MIYIVTRRAALPLLLALIAFTVHAEDWP